MGLLSPSKPCKVSPTLFFPIQCPLSSWSPSPSWPLSSVNWEACMQRCFTGSDWPIDLKQKKKIKCGCQIFLKVVRAAHSENMSKHSFQECLPGRPHGDLTHKMGHIRKARCLVGYWHTSKVIEASSLGWTSWEGLGVRASMGLVGSQFLCPLLLTHDMGSSTLPQYATSTKAPIMEPFALRSGSPKLCELKYNFAR